MSFSTDLRFLAKNPVPSGPSVGAFTAHDGAKLRFARWSATQGPRRGTICLFHGRGEFIEKYFETIADLRRRGFAVATFDWRGQGASARLLDNPRKGHVIDFAEYDRDITRFMKDVVLPDCPPPYIALAHSMGGHILLRHAVEPSSWFERIVLSAPMIALDDEKIGYPQWVVQAYAEVAGLSGFAIAYVQGGTDRPEEAAKFEDNTLTSDKERWSRNKAILDVAPELGIGSPTIGWLRAAYRSCRRLGAPDYPETVRVPIMLFAAGDDKIVSTRAIEEFGVRLKVGSHILIPGARHEILQERDVFRQRFWAAFDAYLGVSELAA
ncbi:MAG: alpha/beta hydrolase [Hyphomicrobiaceae bacterium]|nr:alpha/beta hydrolase [Hyphomicrobiaceae bacterium]